MFSGSLVETVGIAAAVLTTLCWLPQAMKVIREKESRAISLPGTAILSVGVALWLVYGLALGDWPLIGANGLTLIFLITILAMKLRYG